MSDHLDFTLILDRSGSMDPIRSVVLDEANRLLDQLRADDPETTVSIVAFAGHTEADVLVDAIPVRRVRPIAARHHRYDPAIHLEPTPRPSVDAPGGGRRDH